MPGLKKLNLVNCDICDEAVALLAANLGKDDFKALKRLDLDGNQLTDMCCATLVSALDEAGLPALKDLSLANNPFTEIPHTLVDAALRRGIEVYPWAYASDEYDSSGEEASDDDE